MPTLNITVRDKIATGDGQEIVCDNTDYLVRFDLDSEWDSYSAKTMRVLYLDGTYDDVIFTGDTATLPRIYEPNIYSYFTIGIGIYAGDLHSTVAAIFKCKESVLTGGSQHPDPPEDIYNQILEDINSGMLQGETGNGIESVALTSTVGNVDTYTITFTNGDTTTFNITNGAVTSVNGMTGDVSLDDVVAGNAKGLIDTNKVVDEDTSPYVFRPFNQENKDISAKNVKVIGDSVVWNQLANITDGEGTVGGIPYTTSNGKVTVSGTATSSVNLICDSHISIVENHVYLYAMNGQAMPAGGTTSNPALQLYASNIVNLSIFENESRNIKMGKAAGTGTATLRLRVHTGNTYSYSFYPQIVDLTQMFGSAIANRAYTMEQSTAGSGVAWLKSYGFFTKPYYAYTASPSIQSVQVSAHETVGFNQWDEEWELGGIDHNGNNTTNTDRIRSKNYIRVLPNTTYYFKAPSNISIMWYDGDKHFISKGTFSNDTRVSPENAAFLRFHWAGGTTYNNDICINLSHSGYRNGEYEAYVKHEYPFDSSVELRGMLKLDSNNNIYADGDTYSSDGAVARKRHVIVIDGTNITVSNVVLHSSGVYYCTIPLNPTAYNDASTVINDGGYVNQFGVVSGNIYPTSNGNILVVVLADQTITTASAANTYFAETPLTVEYTLATPTTETADPFPSLMIAEPDGTERWIDAAYEAGDRDFEMPVGHITKYYQKTDINKISDRIEANAKDILYLKSYVGFDVDGLLGLEADFKNNVFTRKGAAVGLNAGSDFDSYTMYGGRRLCNVANDGTINAYYGGAGYTEDGSNGQVMVYQPKFYYAVIPQKLEKNTDSNIGYHMLKATYYVSDTPRAGMKLHPAFRDANGNEIDYILLSAYEGSMYDASQNKIVNDSVDTDIAYATGDLLCSVANVKPISGLRSSMGTKEIFESMANNRGGGWHLSTIQAESAEQLLYIIELAAFNTKTALGNGVISITDDSSYNCSSLTGSTASIGNGTGMAESTTNEIGGTETVYTNNGQVSVRYRGRENDFGNIYSHVQGINIWGDGTMGGGQPYVTSGYTYTESSHIYPYTAVGFTLSNSNGYVKAFGYGGKDNDEFDWLFIPSKVGGTSALPVGDYFYITTNLNAFRIARLGGYWAHGGRAGGFCWSCDAGVGNRYRIVGGRLLYVPSAK